jgi:hypothetical protein
MLGTASVPWLIFAFAVLIVGSVILPAVWSTRPERRRAALIVLDRMVTLTEALIRALRRTP